ncbi:hypothetical protein BG006_005564 [Podila minutissima]|uniref:Amino acid permease/ SLC12A domain-containing protein n=1 Tax=Podila minutissima TaxID=64525 RepID=A0A9P5VLZ6_9FUNG|nr:hypothetical protein BG006_005564 [Podila minutissima]
MIRLGIRYDNTTTYDQALTDDQQYGEVKREPKSRHLRMTAIGGIIGAGIFLSSGGSVVSAGPLGALISYTVVDELFRGTNIEKQQTKTA